MFAFPYLLLGLLAVLGPLIIHLLNRRRYRTIDWAAMDFLRAAIRRSKRVMEIRDMLLLALRTLAILFFVLAIAKPFFKKGAGNGRGPVHAVVVVDNSLSMAFQTLDGTLLEIAKERAEETIRRLPAGSRISVIPLCGADEGQAAYVSAEDAVEALGRIQVTDRAGSPSTAAERAKRACEEVADPAAKRAILFTDLQRSDWAAAGSLDKDLAGLEMQVVRIGPDTRANTWVEDFRLVDGIADTESPAVFAATIAHDGPSPRSGLRVAFEVDGVQMEDRVVDLEPGQRRQLIFRHAFDVAGSSGEPIFLPVELRLDADELPEDDSRSVIAPVVARMPVVFVDQMGARESARLNRYGETYMLRTLLASGSPNPEAQLGADQGMVAVRHLSPTEVDKESLADARLVVVAGLESPDANMVAVLREYAEQGGQILLAAGDIFDPVAWNAGAWQDGAGILPMALEDSLVGGMSNARSGPVASWQLDPETLNDPAFDLQVTDDERLELLRSPAFYRYVQVDEESEAKPVAEDTSSAEPTRWLTWSSPLAKNLDELDEAQRAAHNTAFVMGRYSSGDAFAVRRNIGQGACVFVTSGLFPAWNDLAAGPGVLLLDALMRAQLRASLPDRTIAPMAELVVPVSAARQDSDFTITPPDDSAIVVRPELVGRSEYGLRLGDLDQRGVYKIERAGGAAGTEEDERPLLLALNGPASEGQLASLDRAEFQSEHDGSNLIWAGDNVAVQGAAGGGRGLWRWLIALVLLCLLAEMFLLRERPSNEEGSA